MEGILSSSSGSGGGATTVVELQALQTPSGLELEVAVVVDVLVVMLEVAGFKLESHCGRQCARRDAWESSEAHLVFWAGHPEVPVSRRTAMPQLPPYRHHSPTATSGVLFMKETENMSCCLYPRD